MLLMCVVGVLSTIFAPLALRGLVSTVPLSAAPRRLGADGSLSGAGRPSCSPNLAFTSLRDYSGASRLVALAAARLPLNANPRSAPSLRSGSSLSKVVPSPPVWRRSEPRGTSFEG